MKGKTEEEQAIEDQKNIDKMKFKNPYFQKKAEIIEKLTLQFYQGTQYFKFNSCEDKESLHRPCEDQIDVSNQYSDLHYIKNELI